MRQFKLREEKSFVKILKEPPNKKKKVNWSRRVYLVLLIGAVFLLAKRVYNANMIIFAQGQIELPKQTVKFSNDIKVLEFHISKGSKVAIGDTLFTYQIMADEIDQAKLSLRKPNTTDWIIKEELSIKQKMAVNQLMIQKKQHALHYLNTQIAKQESLLLSGVHDEYGTYSSLQEQQVEIMAELEFYSREIALMNAVLSDLKEKQSMYNELNYGELEVYREVKTYLSPVDGVISDIFYELNEICYKKEEMLTLHQLENASVKAYFDPEELDHLSVGDVVDVEFPDKRRTGGVISKFFVSTYAIPSEFQKTYEPTERNIVAEVVPLNTSDEHLWNSFYKMAVKVEKNRYSFDILGMF